MFTVKEYYAEHAREICRKLGAEASEFDRVFVLDEDGPKAAGILSLAGAKVLIKGVYGDISESYRDVMNRSLLHVCRCMNPITVRVESASEYWKKFGFGEADGGMEIKSDEINFKC